MKGREIVMGNIFVKREFKLLSNEAGSGFTGLN